MLGTAAAGSQQESHQGVQRGAVLGVSMTGRPAEKAAAGWGIVAVPCLKLLHYARTVLSGLCFLFQAFDKDLSQDEPGEIRQWPGQASISDTVFSSLLQSLLE